jgi:hypothetical protein
LSMASMARVGFRRGVRAHTTLKLLLGRYGCTRP